MVRYRIVAHEYWKPIGQLIALDKSCFVVINFLTIVIIILEIDKTDGAGSIESKSWKKNAV